MREVTWTPAMETWVQEALSRSKPLTVRQLDILRPLFRKVYEQQQSRDAEQLIARSIQECPQPVRARGILFGAGQVGGVSRTRPRVQRDRRRR